MMVKLGNFLFRYRNGLFPAMYLLLFVPGPGLFRNQTLAFAVGLTIALLGQSIRAATIGLAYIVRGGKDRQVYAKNLVQEGIFAHCRNPLYVGNFLILIGLAIAANSLNFVLIGLPLFAIAYCAIIAAEENYLRQRFGEEYEAYCARVNRFVPKIAGLRGTLQSMEFNWQRLIVKEYGSAYIWTAAAALLLMKQSWLVSHTHPGYSLWASTALLITLTLAYVSARYLKKRGILQPDLSRASDIGAAQTSESAVSQAS